MDRVVADYFAAERAESVLFIVVGALALGAALYLVIRRRRPFGIGLAWPLVAIGLIQLVVGITVFMRSPGDTVRVQHALQADRGLIVTEEVPRMITVVNNFVLYRWVELALLGLGGVLLLAAKRRSGARGAGLGLALQAAFMLVLDALAEQRALQYLAWLKGL